MNIKALLTQAIEAQVAGNVAGANEALKQAIVLKTRSITEGEYQHGYTWEAKDLGEHGVGFTVPAQMGDVAPGYYNIEEADLEYSVHGKYYPETRYEPAEYPELEIGRITGIQIAPMNGEGDYTGDPVNVTDPAVLALIPEEFQEALGNALEKHFNDDTGPFAGEQD